MVVKEGLNIGEKVVDSTRAAYLIRSTQKYWSGVEQWLYGEIVLTQMGVVFLESTGIFKRGRRRHHSIPYDRISGVRTESRGITGLFTSQQFLCIDANTPTGPHTYRYSCNNSDATRLSNRIIRTLQARDARAALDSELVRLIKPNGEVKLSDVSKAPTIRNIVRQMQKRSTPNLSDDEILAIVTDEVRSLISTGKLDGIIDDEGNFVSTLMLSRRSVQYQVTIDFTTLYSQLQNKGIILQTIECPSCGGKLDYPKEGSVLTCRYCGALVSAIDIFEKFKKILNI